MSRKPRPSELRARQARAGKLGPEVDLVAGLAGMNAAGGAAVNAAPTPAEEYDHRGNLMGRLAQIIKEANQITLDLERLYEVDVQFCGEQCHIHDTMTGEVRASNNQVRVTMTSRISGE